ncbi:hypothetical protein PUNSTDRAFT_57324, partial [Punctularia strigosozonata HHB-11173 SS5]|uniref:uncharacterized protein n=1 Tax=Punctularia strigosozonata (strain HHB-11173) TaxID=741275 RepID=UPI0004417492
RMDLCDDPSTSQIVAVLELPGMRKEDIRLEMQNGSLELQPSLKPKSISVSRYPIQELKYGKFERTIRLPFGIEAQPNVVTATMHDGMLTVSWPRRMQSEPCQRIEIN